MASKHCFLLLFVSLLLSSLVVAKSDIVPDETVAEVCYYKGSNCKTVADCVDVCASKGAGAPLRCAGEPETGLMLCCCNNPPLGN